MRRPGMGGNAGNAGEANGDFVTGILSGKFHWMISSRKFHPVHFTTTDVDATVSRARRSRFITRH
ncbi:MAG: hypothetical protein OD918_06720 [Gammaproteobacteria bacterium]